MVRYYGCYASHFKKYIPTNEIKPKPINEIELTHSWGEYEELRKTDLANGKPDPLTCPSCKTELSFDQIYFHRTITIPDG